MCLPPALDARIAVTKAFSKDHLATAAATIQWLLRQYAYAFEADPRPSRSYYLPWNHFGPTLNEVIAGAAMPVVEPEVQSFATYARLLQHFQTPRRLAPGKAAVLEAYAQRVLTMPRAFISYRRKEAAVLAMQAAARAFHHGMAPWWDQWAMPRKIAQEEALCASPSLHKALSRAISQAQCAITIQTPTYGDTPATRLEWERIAQASQSGKLVHVALHAGTPTPTDPGVAKRVVDKALDAVDIMAEPLQARGAALQTRRDGNGLS